MESEKMKEIKKALECCKQNEIEDTCEYCSNCPASDWNYEKECKIDLFQKTLTLINELEKENETKTDTITDLLKKQEFYEKEKLKQFAKMLKGQMNEGEYMGKKYKLSVFRDIDIDEILKEFEL